MGWLRSRSRLGSYLALFALALQLALSFGHVHLEGGAPVSRHSSTLLGVHASTIAATAVDAAGKGAPAPADDFCPICMLIHLAGALVPAEAPSLPLPSVFGQAPIAAATEFDLTTPPRAPFAARAPPTA